MALPGGSTWRAPCASGTASSPGTLALGATGAAFRSSHIFTSKRHAVARRADGQWTAAGSTRASWRRAGLCDEPSTGVVLSSACGEAQATHGRAKFAGRCRAAQEAEGEAATGAATQEATRTELTLTAQVVPSIDKVAKDDWDACALGQGQVNPFLLWDFLHSLEASGSAVKEEGWLPQHLLVRNEETGELLGCCPLYLKGHSYGEYVFDQSWASYSARMGKPYYPKLQCCVPFTPATGPRLLVRPGPAAAAVTTALIQTMTRVTEELGVSSLHVTFNTQEEWQKMRELGFLPRTGIQYHWDNTGYKTFDDFLAALKQSRRKSIRQERKQVASAGVRVRRLSGDDIKPSHWDQFFSFYLNTVDRKWGSAYLTREFFHRLGDSMADNVVLVVAEDETNEPGSGELIAGALNLVGSDTLFGRNWGRRHGRHIKHLHFELCYYSAIEEAIERGLGRVEAGAQGEHKVQRGYLPNLTYSSHYIPDLYFRAAVDDFLRRERPQIEYTLEAIALEASPYKVPPGSDGSGR